MTASHPASPVMITQQCSVTTAQMHHLPTLPLLSGMALLHIARSQHGDSILAALRLPAIKDSLQSSLLCRPQSSHHQDTPAGAGPAHGSWEIARARITIDTNPDGTCWKLGSGDP